MRESTIYFAEEAKTGVKILFREVKLKYFFSNSIFSNC